MNIMNFIILIDNSLGINFVFILSISIVLIVLLEGYLGKTLKSITEWVFNVKNQSFIWLLIYVIFMSYILIINDLNFNKIWKVVLDNPIGLYSISNILLLLPSILILYDKMLYESKNLNLNNYRNNKIFYLKLFMLFVIIMFQFSFYVTSIINLIGLVYFGNS